MKKSFLAILTFVLLSGPVAAKTIQSSTGVQLTFRQCVKGETVCDSIGPMQVRKFAGLPGDREAQARQQDPAYGESKGSVKLTGAPGASELRASISSLPGTRNGSNTFMVQRYTNMGELAESLTFSGTLTYDQTIPAENATFPSDKGVDSIAVAELEIFTINIDAIDVGTTAADNNNFELPDDIVYKSLNNASASGDDNLTGAGSRMLSTTVNLEPGDSIWLFAILQSLGANGAQVNASLSTVMSINKQ